MKIINYTNWKTENIRIILRIVAAKELDPDQIKRLQITLVNVNRRHNNWVGGYAWYHSNRMVLKLPKRGPIDPCELAKVAAHEMAHTHGMKHRDMKGSRRYTNTEGWRELYAWAAEYPIEQKPEPAKPTLADKRLKKLEAAQSALLRWQRKAKLANTKMKKYKLTIKRIEKAVASTAAEKPTT